MDFDYIVINIEELFDYLKNSPKQPIIETELLRKFFADYDDVMSSGINLDTFKMHFVLYHYLYKLKRKLQIDNSKHFIYIKYIYVYLIQKPEKDKCQYFNEELEMFCGEPVETTNEGEEAIYCPFHTNIEESRHNYLDYSDISHYYLNFDNYYKMDEDGLEKTMKGVFKYIKSKDIIEESLDVLSVSLNTPFQRIHERFKYLSKKFHPDINRRENAEEHYKKISTAYQILKDYFDK